MTPWVKFFLWSNPIESLYLFYSLFYSSLLWSLPISNNHSHIAKACFGLIHAHKYISHWGVEIFHILIEFENMNWYYFLSRNNLNSIKPERKISMFIFNVYHLSAYYLSICLFIKYYLYIIYFYLLRVDRKLLHIS